MEPTPIRMGDLRQLAKDVKNTDETLLTRYLAENNECLADLKKRVAALATTLNVLEGQISITMQIFKWASGLFATLVAVVAALCVFIFLQLSSEVDSIYNNRASLITDLELRQTVLDLNERRKALELNITERLKEINNHLVKTDDRVENLYRQGR